jgi:sortase B
MIKTIKYQMIYNSPLNCYLVKVKQMKSTGFTQNENEEYEKRRTHKKRVRPFFLLIISGAVLAGAIICIVLANNRDQSVESEFNQAMASYAPAAAAPVSASPAPAASEEENIFDRTRKKPDRNIDFNGLAAENGDIIAWVSVPGTDIDYPVVHGEDNEYYLSHNALKEESKSGAIFSDMQNTRGFTDPVTVLYGHRMKNGSMFASLHKFEDEAFFKQNNKIEIYTSVGQWEYEIFAAYKTDNANILYGRDFHDKEVYQKYLDSIENIHDLSAHLSGTELTTDDHILTLSTCVEGEEEQRYVVQAVLR